MGFRYRSYWKSLLFYICIDFSPCGIVLLRWSFFNGGKLQFEQFNCLEILFSFYLSLFFSFYFILFD